MENYEPDYVLLYSVVKKQLRPMKTDAVSGRWNSDHTPCVYAAQSISGSLLEFSVHGGYRLMVNDVVVLRYNVPLECIYEVAESELPLGYHSLQHNPRCQHFGTRLLKEGKAVISFPSVFIPGERIFLINLLNEEMRRLHPTRIQLHRPW